jgi:hypothetical protein
MFYIQYTLSVSLPVFEVNKQRGVNGPELLHLYTYSAVSRGLPNSQPGYQNRLFSVLIMRIALQLNL